MVNTKEMLDTFSRVLILKKVPPAQTHVVVIIELVSFTPGSDAVTNTSPSYGGPSALMSRPAMINHHSAPPPRPHPPNGSGHFPTPHHSPHNSMSSAQHSPPGSYPSASGSNGHPPPPPWSRWGTMSTPSMPPSTQRRSSTMNGDASRPHGTPQPQPQPPLGPPATISLDPPVSRKRKHSHSEELAYQLQALGQPGGMSSHHSQAPEDVYPLKRHAGPALTPTPLSPPRPPQQTLSPSLAMIVSPTNQAVHTSPRGGPLPPMRHGQGGSPLLPPMHSLMTGEPRPQL